MPARNTALDLLTTREAADALRSNPRTIERWRTAGRGPMFVHIGRRVVYTRADLELFIHQNRRTHTGKELA